MKHGQRFLIGALATGVLAAALALPAIGDQGALAQTTIIYVDASATGLNNGGSWRNAYTDLQDALDEAEPLDQIWVAAGTYKPSHEFIQGDPRSAAFQMANGVAIYGGFEPDVGITKLEDRDWVTYEAILSGNIGDADRSDDNSYHVFYHPENLALGSSAILDGFTISGGNANEPDYPDGICGGGMYNDHASPTLNNITFVDNSAGNGGALYVSRPLTITEPLALTNVTFVGNSAADGGAVHINAAQATPGEVGDITFANCIFRGNVAERGGGLSITWGEPDGDTAPFRLTNCTFYGNQAGSGGGAYVSEESKGLGWFMLTNAILWGDTPDEIYAEDPETLLLVTYSDIEGGYEGEGNIDEDPAFVDRDSGDLHLQPGSVCIDSANNGPDLAQYDFEGDLRILDGNGDGYAVVDMGVDEYKMPVIPVEISVTPYIPTNVIRLRPGVVVDVAILSTDDFDAVAEVAPDMVEFAGATHVGFTFEDVNRDGHDDVLLDFMAEDMVDLNEDSTEATLTGETQDGVPFEGTAEVKVR
jgi:predicted outer membrane repeat protein